MAITNRSLTMILNRNASESLILSTTIEQLRGCGHSVSTFCVTDLSRALADRPGVVVAVGGDGTVNCVVNLLIERNLTSIPFGVLPFGTGNDFANAAGYDCADLDVALTQILEAKPAPIDVWKLKDRIFVNVTSGGFGAEITSETFPTLKQFLGRFAYSLTGLFKAFDSKDRRVSIQADGHAWEGSLLFLAIANGRFAGGGYQVGPRAYLDDGLLDVLIIPDVEVLDLPALLAEIADTESIENEHVKYFRTSWLEVSTSKGLYLTIDGEPHQSKEFRVERLDRQLLALLPPTAPLTRKPL